MYGESVVTRSIIHDIHSVDIQRDQMEGESGATPSTIAELHSWDIQGEQIGRRKWCYSKYH